VSAVVPHHRIDGPASAPVVVMAHSLGADLRMWDPQVTTLARHLRIVRYDLRGHGGTPGGPDGWAIDDLASDVVALLDHLGVDRASFCGLSLGGMVGLALAATAPERVDRLALCCTAAWLGPPETWHERAAAVRRDGMSAVADTVLGRWFTPLFAASHADMVGAFRDTLLATDVEGYARSCAAVAAMDQRSRLSAITAPTLVLAAALDPSTPPDMGALIASGIPGARFVVVPDAAHLANVEAADLVTAALLAHLALAELDDYERGLRVRREVLGDRHVDAALAGATPLTAVFQRLVTEYAWGGVWDRPGLDRRTRSCITVGMLVALGRWEELALHLRAARTNGVSVDELTEVLLQSAVYCGVPAANHGFAVAAEVLAADQ